MRIQRKSAWLYGALITTLVATWWASRLPENETVDIVEANIQPASATAPAVRETSASNLPAHTAIGKSRLDAFAARDWTPPPPPPPPASPPPPPTAPPLPYRYLGKWASEGGLSVFLQRGNTPHIVKSGDVIDGTWRVDQVQPRAVVFTYLPLNSSITLNTGESL